MHAEGSDHLDAFPGGGINPDSFYGSKKYCPSFHHENINFILPTQLSAKFNKLLGPSTIWKIFKKQDELISFVSQNNCNLLPFTFQTENGNRLFLAANPITFWYYDNQRDMKDRNSYEIIQEFHKCKLYFDLEFDVTLNPNHDGCRMVNTFIQLVCIALKNKYDVSCSHDDILNLNSSTNFKFSCHLIFQLKNEIFRDNYNVGVFVKLLCYEIRSWINEQMENENLLLLPVINLPLDMIRELRVNDSKGNQKLFCDEAVYSKNRHFRLYKSSKFGKNAPLLLCKTNKFNALREKVETEEENIFLCSLITWITDEESKRILEFPPNKLHYSLKMRCRKSDETACVIEDSKRSSFPDIDDCINNVVHPGKIWRTAFFRDTGTIVYDIVGNRYCSNIGRPHKSNNVKYVVDLHTLTYYQKCHDPDCANYKSLKKSLPIDEHFFLNNNIDDDLIATAEDQCEPYIAVKSINNNLFESEISDEDFHNVAVQCERSFLQKQTCSDENVFSNEISDQDMIAMVDCCEDFIASEMMEDSQSDL